MQITCPSNSQWAEPWVPRDLWRRQDGSSPGMRAAGDLSWKLVKWLQADQFMVTGCCSIVYVRWPEHIHREGGSGSEQLAVPHPRLAPILVCCFSDVTPSDERSFQLTGCVRSCNPGSLSACCLGKVSGWSSSLTKLSNISNSATGTTQVAL